MAICIIILSLPINNKCSAGFLGFCEDSCQEGYQNCRTNAFNEGEYNYQSCMIPVNEQYSNCTSNAAQNLSDCNRNTPTDPCNALYQLEVEGCQYNLDNGTQTCSQIRDETTQDMLSQCSTNLDACLFGCS
jgi:hypothetical protein